VDSPVETIERFFWLGFMSLRILFLVWPVGLLFISGTVGALIAAPKVDPRQIRAVLTRGLGLLVVPTIILLCGVLFWESSASPPSHSAELTITVLLLANLPVGALLVWYERGINRWFMLALVVATFGYSIGAWTMSGMAITGDWL
jgi:hypothetical protein